MRARCWLPVVASLFLVVAVGGCTSHGGPGDAGPPLGPSGVACTRACTAAQRCLGSELDVPECARDCAETADPYGELGAAAVGVCAGCLESNGCLAIAGGACDEACPVGGGFGGTRPPPGGDAGTGCDARWLERGTEWSVRCDASSSGYECRCFRGGVEELEDFTSADFCTVSAALQLDEANRGCRWAVGLRADCVQGWESSADRADPIAVVCTGTALGWQCRCSPGPEFFSDAFCERDFVGRTELARAECGYALDGTSSCETTWAPEATRYTARCAGGHCRCLVDGTEVGSFESLEYCIRTIEDRRALVSAGCGWTF